MPMRMIATNLLAAVIAGAALAPTQGASAQALPEGIEPVDQGIADRGPLSTSLRNTPQDLRLPFGFQRLFRFTNESERLVRIDGGLYAMFPESAYARAKNGVIPLIPADTVFSIGTPIELQPGFTGPDRAMNDRIDIRVHDLPPPRRRDAEDGRQDFEPPMPAGKSIVNDEEYRQARLAELMSRAARAAQ